MLDIKNTAMPTAFFCWYSRTAPNFGAMHTAGKQKTLFLGAYPVVGLRDARIKRDETRELLAQDIDLGEKLKSDKLNRLIKAAITFTHVADEFADKLEREGKALR